MRSNGFRNLVTFAAQTRSKVANITSPFNAALCVINELCLKL